MINLDNKKEIKIGRGHESNAVNYKFITPFISEKFNVYEGGKISGIYIINCYDK